MSKNEDFSGLVILKKEKDYTSFDCLSILKKMLHTKKIGHAGTLDKNATGVLICLLGNACKYQNILMNGNKEYDSELIFGFDSDTEDFTGVKIVNENKYFIEENKDIKDVIVNKKCLDENINVCIDVVNDINIKITEDVINNINDIIESFKGEYLQTPPMYSAKKVNGVKLLHLAKKGKEIERKKCELYIENIFVKNVLIKSYNLYKKNNMTCYIMNNDIDSLEDKEFVKVVKLLVFNINIICSKGTYIRTLCKDIGIKLNKKSCMGNLNRVNAKGFDIKDAKTISELSDLIKKDDYSFIKPCFYQDKDTVVTFGKFETLHIGHRKIIEKVVELSNEYKLCSVALIISNNKKTFLTKEQQVSYFNLYGIDSVIDFMLNEYNKNINPYDFVKDILVNQLKCKKLVVGEDCTFGKNAEGNVEFLKKELKNFGIELYVIKKIKINEIITNELSENNKLLNYINADISSTLVKKFYDENELDIVKLLTGRY